MKIIALNEDVGDDSASEGEVTREALEEIAIQQYAKALELQRKDLNSEALQLYTDLLDTELLHEVKKPVDNSKVPGPLLNLKYLCYKNIASIHSQLDNKIEAIEAYCLAAALDNTDVSLWYRLGILCISSEKYELALEAFQRGIVCNPKHWPCLDKLIILLLGLDNYIDCIATIYDAFNLDPDYLRGKVYRKFIYSTYPHVLEYMPLLSPIYSWTPVEDEDVEEEDYEALLKDVKVINEKYVKQVNDNNFVCKNPELKLLKPINHLTWLSVGESLVHMHHYITENMFSHACVLEMNFEIETAEEKMDCSEPNSNPDAPEVMTDSEKPSDGNNCVSENENNDLSDKNATDNEKVESDADNAQQSDSNKQSAELKEVKKAPVRRRGSAISFLEQWEWCTKRRSSRKKTTAKQDRADETVFDTLRRLLPSSFIPKDAEKKEKSRNLDHSPDTMDLYHLFERTGGNGDVPVVGNVDKVEIKNAVYFSSPLEEKDVENFLSQYTENKCDIITIIREFLILLSNKWNEKWPEKLADIFVEANNCLNQHIDPPNCFDDNYEEIKIYAYINICAWEIIIDKKICAATKSYELVTFEILSLLGICLTRPQIFSDDALVFALRYLWAKCQAYLHNKEIESALDGLYQIVYEFAGMGEFEEVFSVSIPNFTTHTDIGKKVALDIIKSLERNKQLSTVMDMYEEGKYEEVKSILLDAFPHCQIMAKNQEYNAMSLDWAVQLSLMLDVHWALGKVEDCFIWSITCLKESLKHYLLCSPGSDDYDKWSMVVVKVLMCIEHILKKEGCYYLDVLREKHLNRLVQNLVEIIGHQLDDNHTLEMPLNTVTPWIILHYVLQREEDQGRMQSKVNTTVEITEVLEGDEIPSSIMILFTGHDYLGRKSWCCNSDCQLLYFTLDTVIPRLRAPALSRSLEVICRHLEQCVFCLFGHPSKKTRLRYLVDHDVTPTSLDWDRAQQIYELYKPIYIPDVQAPKTSSITVETEQLFQRMLSLLPSECSPEPYVKSILAYINGDQASLPTVPVLLPYKIKDIYYLLADYYFKKEDSVKSLKYNIYDVIVNNDRFDSWAAMALTRATNLGTRLDSCENFKNDMDYLDKANSAQRCFKRALELDPANAMLWIEYGTFVYSVHSFCSRLLKQASESLSMEDFEELEQRKEDMLNTAQASFIAANREASDFYAEDKAHDEKWLHFYMLGKISEKRGNAPREYLNYYIKASKYLQESNATYPSKINYNSPQNLSIEALEIHYRIHASILKYIVLHENKEIFMSDGKAFMDCLKECVDGPFSNKRKGNRDGVSDSDNGPAKVEEVEKKVLPSPNILKRSISDSGDEPSQNSKKIKIDTCAQVRRTMSYDECAKNVDVSDLNDDNAKNDGESNKVEQNIITNEDVPVARTEVVETSKLENNSNIEEVNPRKLEEKEEPIDSQPVHIRTTVGVLNEPKPTTAVGVLNEPKSTNVEIPAEQIVPKNRRSSAESISSNAGSSKDDSSSKSSSSSSSEDSSSDSSSDSSDSVGSKQSENLSSKPMSQEDISDVISTCLDSLEDCVSRLPQHYKALYRLAHYHFYYKKGKDIERCRDLMLASFTCRNGSKLVGLFSVRKNSNFFNGIWKIPVNEIDRPGSFASHMSRCVLLSMEILKEIDDHKTLLDISVQLQKTPDPDKKYLRDSEREELSQQAFSLCIQSLKGQLAKFSQQADLRSNEEEKKALCNFMLDIYRAYQKAQKHTSSASSKQFANLLIDGYKLSVPNLSADSTNLLDASLKYCQAQIASLKQKAMAGISAGSLSAPSSIKQSISKNSESTKVVTIPASMFLPKVDPPISQVLPVAKSSSLADLNKSLYNSYWPGFMNDPNLNQAAAAAFYMANGYSMETLQKYQADLLYMSYTSNMLSNNLFKTSKGKQAGKSAKSTSSKQASSQLPKAQQPKSTKALSLIQPYPITKVPDIPSSLLPKSLAPTIGSSIASTSFGPNSQPAHMPTTTSYTASTATVKPAHMSTTSTMSAALHTKPPLPHQQVSPGKTLQEKLAERQKQNPKISKTAAQTLQDVNASITSKLPPTLTVTKTLVNQRTPVIVPAKKDKPREGNLKKPQEVRRPIPFDKEKLAKPKNPINSSEIIVLDDD